MHRKPGAVGWFIAGTVAGAALLLLITARATLDISSVVSPIDVLQLAATIFLALYIPLRIQSILDFKRSSQELLAAQIREFLEKVISVNRAITECASSGTTTPLARNQIIYGFKAAAMRLGLLESIIAREYAGACSEDTNDLVKAYRSFWRSVTDGNIFTTGAVDWVLWQAQEFKFVCVLSAGNDLIRSIGRN